MPDDRWTDEADRLYRRYQSEIVEACGLCPWAERARVDGRFQTRVLLQSDPRATEDTLHAIDALVADPRAEVAVFVYPRLGLGRREFERFVAAVRDLDAARHPLGEIPYVFAAFHPEASPDASDPERMIPFLRRTPDPTIQLLRSDVLERVRSATPQGTQYVDIHSLDALEADAKAASLSLRQRYRAHQPRDGRADRDRRDDAAAGSDPRRPEGDLPRDRAREPRKEKDLRPSC